VIFTPVKKQKITNLENDISETENNEEKTNLIDKSTYSINSNFGIKRLFVGLFPAIIALGTLPMPPIQATILLSIGYILSAIYDIYFTKIGLCPFWFFF
jgi:hypothetical protein